MRRTLVLTTLAASTLALTACGGGTEEDAPGVAAEASIVQALAGKLLFDLPLPGTNGRSCATCHAQASHFALSSAGAEARFQANPHDPLFHPLDADDPTAASPTFDHLRRRGLVRITLPLAPNLDLVDAAGNVVTGPARTLSVWRGVPTVENTALTAPYLYDGRADSLQQQALGALRDHSQIAHDPSNATLNRLAAYEKTVFSSGRVAHLAAELAEGEDAFDPDPHFAPGSPEAAGKALFQQACTACHGGGSGAQIVAPEVQAQFFPVLDAKGSPVLQTLPDGTVASVPSGTHASDAFLVLGIAGLTYLTQVPPQLGGIPNPDGLAFPQYRLRFYTDATRTQKVFDLPPAPFDPGTQQPVNGRNFFPQLFSVDPGRAIITGDPADFEAFDVPQVRGVARTAPYFHDNSAPDLETLVDIYSRFILPAIPPIGLPPVVPPAGPGLPPESLTAAQKAQLVAYLKKI
jgi:cytochrome c peroxidase